MRSNYRRLGEYIKEVKNRNSDAGITNLLGINIDKYYMPSVANIVGTDLSVYKVVQKNQFACNRMHVGRDKRLPVALSRSSEKFIVSPAYDVFEIRDTGVLDPEYLMMWFSRKEFDRNAWFYTDADVRGGLNWKAFCEMELPIPSIEKQREIVEEYHTLVNRIDLNQRMIQKLEETAQAIYKQWFVDFEFPISAEMAQEMGNPELEGKPYKSNGGEMVVSELGEIPRGWKVGCINDVIKLVISHRGKSKSLMKLMPKGDYYIYPVISAMNISQRKIVKHNTISYVDSDTFNDWMDEKLIANDLIMTSEAPMGELYFVAKNANFVLSQRLFALRVNDNVSRGIFSFFWLQTSYAQNDMVARATGTTVLGIKLSELKKVIHLLPPIQIVALFEQRVKIFLQKIENIEAENLIMDDLRNLLLSKMATINN